MTKLDDTYCKDTVTNKNADPDLLSMCREFLGDLEKSKPICSAPFQVNTNYTYEDCIKILGRIMGIIYQISTGIPIELSDTLILSTLLTSFFLWLHIITGLLALLLNKLTPLINWSINEFLDIEQKPYQSIATLMMIPITAFFIFYSLFTLYSNNDEIKPSLESGAHILETEVLRAE